METVKGKFVVLEGIDGAGTTTQVARLSDRLQREGRRAVATHEPSAGPVGTMIRQILTGRLVVPGGRGPGWATMALLFAADRMDHVEATLEPNLREGCVVISDRYDASSLAYQSAMSGRDPTAAVEWIRQLNRHALRPDLTIVLDVPADVAAARRLQRGDPAQLYEQNELQRALEAFYRELPRHMPQDRVVVVDGQGTAEQTHEKVWAVFREVCG